MKQTIIYKLCPDKSQSDHLHNLALIATKLYNIDNYTRRKAWEETGKIPNWYDQKKTLKTNHWYKLLPSQTAQEVCHSLHNAYGSWFRLRKGSPEKHNPPGFRKKSVLSPLSFYQHFRIDNSQLRLSMSMKYRSEHQLTHLNIPFISWKPSDGNPKFCQILHKKNNWYAHIVFEDQEPIPAFNEKVMAIDLGIINTATTVDSEGRSHIYSGKQIMAIQHYFNKERAKLQSVLAKQYPNRKSSRSMRIMSAKRNRQLNQALHNHSKRIIDDCASKNIKVLVVGDITNIRSGKRWNKKASQKLHSWSFSKFAQQLEYKAVRAGIRFVRVNEKYTSITCSKCGTRKKSHRKHRGLLVCKTCGNTVNADVNGATNILNKYLRDFISRSIGDVASPSVTRLRGVVA
jgi:putative transposase